MIERNRGLAVSTVHSRTSYVFFLLLAFTFAMLTGCGGGSGSSSNNFTNTTNPAPPGSSNPAPSGSSGAPTGNGTPAGSPPAVTTTLQAETANNTSASNSFSGQPTQLPKPVSVSKVDTHSLLYTGSTTKVYAHLLGWFGESGHMDVGYHSDDPAQVHRQVEDMISRGIQGAILDWFGPNETVVNGAAQALRKEAEAHAGFEFAIMEDAGALFDAAKANSCDVTSQLLSDLAYINTQYTSSSAYMKVNGRPVILFFGVDAFYINWTRVRQSVTNNPLFLFRGTDGLTRPISDGGFQWLDINADPFHPASPNPFDPALAPQESFYQTKTNGRVAIGSVYARFNDALAPWGIDRFVHTRCGQTWLDTFADIGKFYSSSNQLPSLQIVTWNDYDEGTAIEPGIDNCVSLQPTVSGTTLSWAVAGGPESTIDHYTVYASTDGQNLAKLADVASGTHSLDLSPYNLSSGPFTIYVKATGRPSIQNKVSPAIVYRAGDQPPKVNLSVSQTTPLAVTVSTSGSSDPDGTIASSTINFGDGTSMPGPTATHTYTTPGSYDIAATVTDNAGASAVAVQRVSAKSPAPGVTIFSPTQSAVVNWPMPNFTATANSGNPIKQMNVLLDGTQIYAIDQDVVNTPLKIYSGNHQVQFQAVDTAGATSTAAVSITAEPGDPAPTPVIQVTHLPELGANSVLLCGANWQAPNRFVNAYKWTFSDGSAPAFTPAVVHTFPSVGTFSVTQDVINEFGTPGSVTQPVTVTGMSSASTAVHVQNEKAQKQNLPIRLPPR